MHEQKDESCRQRCVRTARGGGVVGADDDADPARRELLARTDTPPQQRTSPLN
jgi:hypothetical protein